MSKWLHEVTAGGVSHFARSGVDSSDQRDERFETGDEGGRRDTTGLEQRSEPVEELRENHGVADETGGGDEPDDVHQVLSGPLLLVGGQAFQPGIRTIIESKADAARSGLSRSS